MDIFLYILSTPFHTFYSFSSHSSIQPNAVNISPELLLTKVLVTINSLCETRWRHRASSALLPLASDANPAGRPQPVVGTIAVPVVVVACRPVGKPGAVVRPVG